MPEDVVFDSNDDRGGADEDVYDVDFDANTSDDIDVEDDEDDNIVVVDVVVVVVVDDDAITVLFDFVDKDDS